MLSVNKRLTICIFVEHPEREIEIANEIAKKITSERNGSTVKVLSITFYARIRSIWKSDLIIFPSNWPVIEPLMQIFPNKTFISLNYEQVLSKFNKQSKAITTFNMLKNLHHLSWSQEFNQFLTNQGVKRDRIYLTDKYVYELYNDTNRINLAQSYIFEYRKIYKRILFFPLTDIQGFRSDEILRRTFDDNELYLLAKDRRDFVRRTLRTLLQEIVLFCAENTGSLIILRPHPNVTKEDYTILFEAMNLEWPKNFVIHTEFNALDWIVLADLTISNYSSLLLDAKKLGVPCAIVCSEDFPTYLKVDWINNFIAYRSLFEVGDILYPRPQTAALNKESKGITEAAMHILKIAEKEVEKKRHVELNIEGLLMLSRFFVSSYVRKLLYRSIPKLLSSGVRKDFFDPEVHKFTYVQK